MQKKGLSMAILSLLGITLLVGGWVFAGGPGLVFHGHGFHVGHAQAHHMAMMHMMEELDLSDDQEQYIENIHQILSAQKRELVHVHGHGVEWLLEKLDEGAIDNVEVQAKIDLHAEQFREIGYGVGDEFAALFNSLNVEQRDILAEHLQKAFGRGLDLN